MRLVGKLSLLALLGALMQVGMQTFSVVGYFPFAQVDGKFDASALREFDEARQNFRQCNGVTRWVVSKVLLDSDCFSS